MTSFLTMVVVKGIKPPLLMRTFVILYPVPIWTFRKHFLCFLSVSAAFDSDSFQKMLVVVLILYQNVALGFKPFRFRWVRRFWFQNWSASWYIPGRHFRNAVSILGPFRNWTRYGENFKTAVFYNHINTFIRIYRRSFSFTTSTCTCTRYFCGYRTGRNRGNSDNNNHLSDGHPLECITYLYTFLDLVKQYIVHKVSVMIVCTSASFLPDLLSGEYERSEGFVGTMKGLYPARLGYLQPSDIIVLQHELTIAHITWDQSVNQPSVSRNISDVITHKPEVATAGPLLTVATSNVRQRRASATGVTRSVYENGTVHYHAAHAHSIEEKIAHALHKSSITILGILVIVVEWLLHYLTTQITRKIKINLL